MNNSFDDITNGEVTEVLKDWHRVFAVIPRTNHIRPASLVEMDLSTDSVGLYWIR